MKKLLIACPIVLAATFALSVVTATFLEFGSLGFDLTVLTDGMPTQFIACCVLYFAAFGFLVYLLFFKGKGGKGGSAFKVKDKKKGIVESNLENARFMSGKERDALFPRSDFKSLAELKKDGVPVRAEFFPKGKSGEMAVNFLSPCHGLVIGSTGSGKTTTFINPMIQLLCETGAKPSMIITDPKGELFSLHSKKLAEKGYTVRVLDLRDTYSSYRWNPLSAIYDDYQKYAFLQEEVFERTDDVNASGLELRSASGSYREVWYEFDNKAFSNTEQLVTDIKISKQKIFDEVYEDLNDLVSVLVPVQNDNDPMWEKGARTIVLATLLAMLEDSEDEARGMTKEKFNFYNLTKILQNSSEDYMALRRYFGGRDILSKAYSLSKQVLDSADTTRASYMSIVYEKLALFNDMGVCALTSASDIEGAEIAETPTALFLKIPDEKDTRHNLAAVFILNIYKALIKVASAREDLALPRSVYYVLDEFGNMPKIEKFDKMITVGRSRKIWFEMVVQSYGQLNNVYGDTVADIVKGNCGLKMFIGSNDLATCKEFSELCGNCTVMTHSSSKSGAKYAETSYSTSVQTRPLIYPSELQKLNNKTDTGNSIVVTFGNNPLKTKFTPSYKVPLYKTGQISLDEVYSHIFSEDGVFYDVERRNREVLG